MKACPSASERTLVEAPATIRTATVADASGIARVHVATSRAAYRTLVPPAAMERLSFPERAHCWESILAAAPHGTRAWVAVSVSGGAVGFAAAGHARDHDGKAVQHFLPSGSFAILPLTGKRSSIV